MSEENRALTRRFTEEVWGKGNLSVIDEMFSPDFISHDPSSLEEVRGPEGVRRFIERFRLAFPDARMTIEDQVAEEDKVVSRWTARGTHLGELMGIAPSGNRVEVSGITIDRISGGKFVESWDQYDALSMLQQIGAISELGQTKTTGV